MICYDGMLLKNVYLDWSEPPVALSRTYDQCDFSMRARGQFTKRERLGSVRQQSKFSVLSMFKGIGALPVPLRINYNVTPTLKTPVHAHEHVLSVMLSDCRCLHGEARVGVWLREMSVGCQIHIYKSKELTAWTATMAGPATVLSSLRESLEVVRTA